MKKTLHWSNGGGGTEPHLAFTLAEALITLGIIGVVAAMTMPSLIAKYQQKTFETAFKKQYSVLSNAINYITMNESLNECYHSTYICPTEKDPNNSCYSAVTTDCLALKTELISNLKLSLITNDFIYPGRDKVISEGGVTANSTVVYDNIFKNMDAYLIPDGAIVFLYARNSGGGMIQAQIVIDVNGKKGPNRWGYDVFWLSLVKNNDKLILNDKYSTLSEKGGSLPRNILMNKWSNDLK